jgi:hypothetical protein
MFSGILKQSYSFPSEEIPALIEFNRTIKTKSRRNISHYLFINLALLFYYDYKHTYLYTPTLPHSSPILLLCIHWRWYNLTVSHCYLSLLVRLFCIYISAQMRVSAIFCFVGAAASTVPTSVRLPLPNTEYVEMVEQGIDRPIEGLFDNSSPSRNRHSTPDTNSQHPLQPDPAFEHNDSPKPVVHGAVASESKGCSEAALKMMRTKNKTTGKYGNSVDSVSIPRPTVLIWN